MSGQLESPPFCPTPAPTALIACKVVEPEIAALGGSAAHIVRREYFEIGLHDRPLELRATLTGAIARAEADPVVQNIVLAYGLCGLALVDLTPQRCTLIVPRAHDCMTLFLGSKERYSECMKREPGSYWYAPGWNRAGRLPGPEREARLRVEYTEKFGAEDAEELLAAERETFSHYTTAAYTDLGMPGDEAHRQHAQRCAAALGWRFEHRPGDPSLLRDLLRGAWDEARFLIVKPGQRIAHSVDAAVIKTVPVPPAAGA